MKRNRLVILIGLIVFALLMGWEWRRSENWKENGSPAPEATAPAEKPSPPAATAPFRITGTQLDRNAAENFQLEVKSSGYAGRYSMVAELIHQEGTEIKTDVIAKEEGVLNHDGDPIRYLIPEERVMGPLMGAKERGKYTSYQVRIRLRALDLPSSPNPRKSEATALHVIYPFLGNH